MNPLKRAVCAALEAAQEGRTKLPDTLVKLPGMSGQKYRIFINELLGSLSDARYLEVGSWTGSTLCSAIHGNNVKALAIDDWSQFMWPGTLFFYGLAHFITPGASVSFLNQDFREIDFRGLRGAYGYNVYFFDGPHSERDQYEGIMQAQDALDDEFVLIVDDWNWSQPRKGTERALETIGAEVLFRWEIRTTEGDDVTTDAMPAPDCNLGVSDWHNGYAIFVLRKAR